MSNLNGKGPRNSGPRTGRGMGNCRPSQNEDSERYIGENPHRDSEPGIGTRGLRCFGRRNGQGPGMCRRNRFGGRQGGGGFGSRNGTGQGLGRGMRGAR